VKAVKRFHPSHWPGADVDSPTTGAATSRISAAMIAVTVQIVRLARRDGSSGLKLESLAINHWTPLLGGLLLASLQAH
jgi:hypothetical protein